MTGQFSAPPRTRVWADLPQPVPVEERVFPPRRPDVPPAPVQDAAPPGPPQTAPVPRPWGRRTTGVRWPRRRRGPRPRSLLLAATLGLFLGPIGLLYNGFRHLAAAVLAGSVAFILTLVVGVALTSVGTTLATVVVEILLVGPVCAVWGAGAAAVHNRRLTG